MPDSDDIEKWNDAELIAQITALRRMMDEAAGEGLTPDPATLALIRQVGNERERRRADRLREAATFATTRIIENSISANPGYRNPELHEKNKLALERMARELGVPLSIPPGTDLSIPEVYEELIIELYSFSEYLKDLQERQKRGEGPLAGMGTVERIGEALKRALTSGKLSEAVMAELRKLLDPKLLKMLPILLAVGVGLGALGAGGAFIMLAMSYGPIIWDLVKALMAAAEATTAAEFNAAVGALIKVFGAIGAEVVTTIGGVLLGKALKGAKRVLFPETPPNTARPPRGRTGKSGVSRRPQKPRRPIRPTWPDGRPRSYPRKRPPWLTPEKARRTHRKRLGLENPPDRVRGPTPSGGYRDPPGGEKSWFDVPENAGKFSRPSKTTGKKRELIFGDLGDLDMSTQSGIFGLTAWDGRIIINKVLKPAMKAFDESGIGDFDEYMTLRKKLIETLKHEGAHRRLRPHSLPEPLRGSAAKRLHDVYKESDIVRALDEIYGFGYGGSERRFDDFLEFWQGITTSFDPQHFFGLMRMGRAGPAMKQLPYLLDDDYFRMIGRDPDAWLRLVREGKLDFMEYLRALERFIARARAAKSKPLD